jgi:hypothetical protein
MSSVSSKIFLEMSNGTTSSSILTKLSSKEMDSFLYNLRNPEVVLKEMLACPTFEEFLESPKEHKIDPVLFDTEELDL